MKWFSLALATLTVTACNTSSFQSSTVQQAESGESGPGPGDVETLLGFHWDADAGALSLQLASGGCTKKSDFRFTVNESLPAQLMVLRQAPDNCDALVKDGVTLTFDRSELGLGISDQLGKDFVLSNSVKAPSFAFTCSYATPAIASHFPDFQSREVSFTLTPDFTSCAGKVYSYSYDQTTSGGLTGAPPATTETTGNVCVSDAKAVGIGLPPDGTTVSQFRITDWTLNVPNRAELAHDGSTLAMSCTKN